MGLIQDILEYLDGYGFKIEDIDYVEGIQSYFDWKSFVRVVEENPNRKFRQSIRIVGNLKRWWLERYEDGWRYIQKPSTRYKEFKKIFEIGDIFCREIKFKETGRSLISELYQAMHEANMKHCVDFVTKENVQFVYNHNLYTSWDGFVKCARKKYVHTYTYSPCIGCAIENLKVVGRDPATNNIWWMQRKGDKWEYIEDSGYLGYYGMCTADDVFE